MNYSNYKFSFDKYKNKTFIEVAKEIITKDEKYISIIGKTIVNPKISSEKKKEFQNFLEFFHNYFLKNKDSLMSQVKEESKLEPDEIISLPPKSTIAGIVIKQTNDTISHIIHISDIHIRLYNRQKEYADIFQKLFQKIKEIKATIPNLIIIITGDLLHSKNILSPESILITQQFLQRLAEITTTLLIAGNHDALLTNNQREDSITAITKNIEIPNFHYLKYSGVYIFENLAIAVNSIIDNKWIFARDIQKRDTTTHTIALYHGSVGLCETGVGFRMRGEKLVDDFAGYDYALLGDIHKFQFMDPEGKRIAYASSLIAQNFSEWNHPHGLLLWDLFEGNHQYHEIPNSFGFFVFNLHNNQLFLEKEAVQLENIPTHIQHLESGINLKLNINQCSPDFIASVNYVVKKTIRDARIIHNYITGDESEQTSGNATSPVGGTNQFNMTHGELLTQYLAETYKTLKPADMEYIIEKYNQYHIDAEIANDRELAHWELIDLEFSNMFAYGADNYIDFSRFNSSSQSPIGIIAPNSHGKSSLIDIILLTLFTKFSRTRGTGVSKDIINIHCNNFKTKLNFKIGSEKYTILKEGKRELSEKIKITKNDFYKVNEAGETILLTDEDRKKTDKVIQDLIGSYDDFIFTNVQLQNNTNSFKEMTDKERKEYLYKVLKLDVWNNIVKMIADITKPIRNTITFLEKSTENKSRDDYECKIKGINEELKSLGDAIQNNKLKKDGILNEMGNLRNKLGPNIGEKYDLEKMEIENKRMGDSIKKKRDEIKDISSQIKESEEKLEGLRLVSREGEIIKRYEVESQSIPPFTSTQHLRKKMKVYSKLELEEIIKDTDSKVDKKEIDNLKKLYDEYYSLKIEYASKLYKMTPKDENLLKIETSGEEIKQTLKAKTKELSVVNKKITTFSQEYEAYKMNEEIHRKYQVLLIKKIAVIEFIKALESHEYDPKCIYCVKHPTVKQKMEKEKELCDIEKEMEELRGALVGFDFDTNESYIQSMAEIKEKLEEKKSKKITLESSIAKIELEIEKEANIIEKQDDIKNKLSGNKGIQGKIDKLGADCSELQGRIKGIEEIAEAHSIALEIVEIESKNRVRSDFEGSEIYKDFVELESEKKMRGQYQLNIANLKIKYNGFDYDIQMATDKIAKNNEIIEKVKDYEKIMIENRKIETGIYECETKIREIEKEINSLNQKNGILTQQRQSIQKEYDAFLKNVVELKEKKNECGLLQILEQSLGKDGLPLKILNTYLQPITDSINSIIAPFIPRKIKLHINNDDLILDSFTSSDSTKSVFIHGGMESFILDIAFKITLSNFAKLPKCNILFLDEGISAFDNERLSNIDMLFNFINRYFSKTILITHIDSIKENIQEKINIIKDEQYSKIVCHYN